MPDARISVHDREPLRRRRLVVLLRALLSFPHYLVLSIWALLLVPVLPFSWVAALFAGRVPGGLHRFLAAFLRYSGQVGAWLYLLSATYPDPLRSRDHPFAVDVPEREAQRRLVTLLRLP
ncbi:MAG TPA: DUF4389 domain-containing protein, partial [Gaiellaceae bacterium]